MRPILFFIIFHALPAIACAQRYYPTGVQSREIIGIAAGTNTFYGDIEGRGPMAGLSPHLGLTYEYRTLQHLGIRITALWYRLEAADANSQRPELASRNLSFQSSNWEFSTQLAAYLFPYRPGSFESRSRFNAYAIAGIGFTAFNPKANYAGTLWELRSMQTEGIAYGQFSLVIPYGIGIQYSLAPQFDLGLQLTYHYTFTDHLDDVSTRYRDQATFDNPIAAALADRSPELGLPARPAGSIRGNPGVNDSYSMLSLRGLYYLKRYQYRGREINRLYQ